MPLLKSETSHVGLSVVGMSCLPGPDAGDDAGEVATLRFSEWGTRVLNTTLTSAHLDVALVIRWGEKERTRRGSR